MADALDPDDESINEIDCSGVPRYPPDWISTNWLETEVWNAILDDTPGSTEKDIDKYNDGFEDPPDVDDDEEEEEEEKRRSTFTLLVGMRPLLGELLGGPPIPWSALIPMVANFHLRRSPVSSPRVGLAAGPASSDGNEHVELTGNHL